MAITGRAIAALSLVVSLALPSVGFSQHETADSASRADPQHAGRDHKREPVTHLNVAVRQLVNVESFCIDDDNSVNNLFYFDRQLGAPLSIPKGFSFVVTDIVVFPGCDVGASPDPNFVSLAIVETAQAVRGFIAQFSGKDVKHFSLTAGLAYSAGNEPRPRNTTLSSGRVEIQLMGYFIYGTAPLLGTPPQLP